MATSTAQEPISDWHTYHRVSKTGTYSFLAALPLILMYEVLIVAANERALSQVRVGAEVWLKQLLEVVGSAGLLAFGGAVLLVGAAVFWTERKQRIPLRPRYFLWMILESAVYGVLVAIIVSGIVGAILSAAAHGFADVSRGATAMGGSAAAGLTALAAPAMAVLQEIASMDLTLKLALSIGAGVYEELLFRVILVGGLYWLLRRTTMRRGLAYAVAAVIGALIFSWVHYIGVYGDAFALGSFLFRFVFGLILNLLFLLRGFGIAAWTHALYDVMLVVGVFG